jgi:hypothetical protein
MLKTLPEALTRGRCVSLGMPDMAAVVLNGRSSPYSTNSKQRIVYQCSPCRQIQISFHIDDAHMVILPIKAP